MPIREKKKVYLFDKRHERQFKSVFQGQSLAIYFWSDKRSKYIFTDRIKKIKTITIHKKMRIILYTHLLPRHCDGKLVEQILDLLQIYPEERALLRILGDYIKNDLFEYIGYWGVLIGIIGSCCSGGISCVVIIVSPLAFHSYLGICSIYIVATSSTLFILNVFYDNALGLKFGRWMGDLIEGTHRKPINLKELAEKLMARIHNDEIEEAVAGIVNEEARMSPYKDSSLGTQENDRLARQCLDHFWSTGSTMREAAEINTFRGCQQSI